MKFFRFKDLANGLPVMIHGDQLARLSAGFSGTGALWVTLFSSNGTKLAFFEMASVDAAGSFMKALADELTGNTVGPLQSGSVDLDALALRINANCQ